MGCRNIYWVLEYILGVRIYILGARRYTLGARIYLGARIQGGY